MRRLIILPVRLYPFVIAPLLPPACRYFPSCSNYMIQAVQKHGAFKGVYYGAKRLLRCAPWGGHGYDPVP
jgi:putative membrane protein insertion efficiency factor